MTRSWVALGRCWDRFLVPLVFLSGLPWAILSPFVIAIRSCRGRRKVTNSPPFDRGRGSEAVATARILAHRATLDDVYVWFLLGPTLIHGAVKLYYSIQYSGSYWALSGHLGAILGHLGAVTPRALPVQTQGRGWGEGPTPLDEEEGGGMRKRIGPPQPRALVGLASRPWKRTAAAGPASQRLLCR